MAQKTPSAFLRMIIQVTFSLVVESKICPMRSSNAIIARFSPILYGQWAVVVEHVAMAVDWASVQRGRRAVSPLAWFLQSGPQDSHSAGQAVQRADQGWG